MIVQNAFPGLSLDEAFARNTDGVDCPIARCYAPEDFVVLCSAANFNAEYLGGYLSKFEVDFLKRLKDRASRDARLADIHKDFLNMLSRDADELPMFSGKYAGIGGVYLLKK